MLYPEHEVVLHFSLHRGVVHVKRRQGLQGRTAGVSEASSGGLRRREGNLNPLLGLRGVENRSPRTVRLHRVVQLKHGRENGFLMIYTTP